MSSPAAVQPPLSVVAAVMVGDTAELPGILEAVGRQVYGPHHVVAVGGADAARAAVAGASVGDTPVAWSPSLEALIKSLDATVSHIWIVHGAARPKPDALEALVEESQRADAGVAGSKILRLHEPNRLVSVGVATDVFEVPYFGLDPEEMDQGQYDVVRDVAVVTGASMLVRRDLATGLGGPDRLLPRQAAAVDLCQRARLRGARVVVVPSSEVLYPEDAGTGMLWREEAGRIRAAIKVYSALTLAWVLPLQFLTGLLEALVAPFLGRWTLFSWVRAWAWNLVWLGSTLGARRAARRGRVVGDEELFRYQLRGSVKLREMASALGERVRRRFPEDAGFGLTDLGRDIQQPVVIAALTVGFVTALAARSLWGDGLPSAGYTLGLPTSGPDALRAYAGGWNPAGLGTPEPLRPIVGLAAVAQTVLFGRAGLAATVLTLGAVVLGIWGTARLLRTWGVSSVAGVVAGIVLVAGPATRGITGKGEWGVLIGVGVLPWAVRAAVRSWPERWIPRLGRLAGLAVLVGITAAAAPVLLVAPAVLVVLWVIVADLRAWPAAMAVVAATAVGAGLLFPWLGAIDLAGFLEAGPGAFWEPGIPLAAAVVAAAAVVIVAAPRPMAVVAAWGIVTAAGGAVVARLDGLGAGREVESLGQALAALGTAAVVGAAVEALMSTSGDRGWRRGVLWIGAGGAGVVLVSTLLVVAPGRMGLPADELTPALSFTSAEAGMSRALLVGPADSLPGDVRSLDGAPYRVVSTPLPALWEVWLGDPLLGDEALEATLRSIIAGETTRAGEALAPFGIRWVVVMGESPFEEVFDGQLDMLPLGGLRRPTYVSEAPDAVRALTDAGAVWSTDLPDYTGPAAAQARVRVAENANGRWGPDPWQQDDWANTVSASLGVARVDPWSAHARQAAGSGVLLISLLLLSWWGRRRR
jgi:GT2 family glycosyltransferase